MVVEMDKISEDENQQTSASMSSETSNNTETNHILYKRRWFYLATLGMLNISNAIIWLAFAPVAYQSKDFYNTSIDTINMLSVVFMITGIPCGIVATWLLDTFGLRGSLLASSWLNCVGCLIRVISAVDGINENARVPVVFIGQILAALAQPFMLFAPTKLAALWFPDNQRATANMASTMCNPLGIMLANILSPILAERGILFMLAIQSIPAFLAVIMATFGICSSNPPTPPSSSAETPSEPFIIGVKKLAKNKMYWLLALAIGGGIGLFSVLTTLLSQILCPWGYTDKYIGAICASAMIGAGLVGAAIAGVIVDYTKKFILVTKLCFAFAILGLIAFTVMQNMPDLQVPIALSCGFFGLFGLPVYPIGNELAVETTYPVGEATSSGILFMFGQVQGIILVVVMSAASRAMDEDELGNSKCTTDSDIVDMSVPCYIMVGYAVVICLVFLLIFQTPYRRILDEENKSKSSSPVESTTVYENTKAVGDANPIYKAGSLQA